MENSKFTKIFSTGLLIALSSCSTKKDVPDNIQKENSLIIADGFYVGLEEIFWTNNTGKKEYYKDPAFPQNKWYHLGSMHISKDSAFFNQAPVYIESKGDTVFSESDGGFYNYSGTITQNGDSISLNLVESNCDYCIQTITKQANGEETVVKKKKKLIGRLSKEGLIINNKLYRRVAAEYISHRYPNL